MGIVGAGQSIVSLGLSGPELSVSPHTRMAAPLRCECGAPQTPSLSILSFVYRGSGCVADSEAAILQAQAINPISPITRQQRALLEGAGLV